MEKIGYLGPYGSYSSIAAEKMRPKAELSAYQSFPQLFSSLVSSETDAIVIPIENTLNGGVLQNIDLLQATEGAYATEECVIKIDHRLAYKAGADKRKKKNIYSHAQALEQCSKYLFENFPKARLIPTASTAASLEKIITEADAGVVGAHTKKDGLILSPCNIADEDGNFTHFLLVKLTVLPETARSEKIYFSVTCANRSGALLLILERISVHGLNMTKIESRPIKNAPDEYRFFIETEGDYSSARVKSALADIRKITNSFKLLGCY